jgi:pimeloyl-ACP methyl ester carboxylesterase
MGKPHLEALDRAVDTAPPPDSLRRACNGLSDWEVREMSLELWVRDLETVVDAAGVARFALMGISQGGAVAISYAARHPERVSHLILHGAYSQGWKSRVTAEELEGRRALVTLIRLNLGGKIFPVSLKCSQKDLFPMALRWSKDGGTICSGCPHLPGTLRASWNLVTKSTCAAFFRPFRCQPSYFSVIVVRSYQRKRAEYWRRRFPTHVKCQSHSSR